MNQIASFPLKTRRAASQLHVVVGWSLAMLSGLLAAQDPAPPAEATAVFSKILGGVNAATSSSITGTIPDGQTASFTLKGATGGNLDVAKADKELQKWFDAGAKGGGWTQTKSVGGGNPWATFKRKSDGRSVTVTLKVIKGKYYLSSFEERG